MANIKKTKKTYGSKGMGQGPGMNTTSVSSRNIYLYLTNINNRTKLKNIIIDPFNQSGGLEYGFGQIRILTGKNLKRCLQRVLECLPTI